MKKLTVGWGIFVIALGISPMVVPSSQALGSSGLKSPDGFKRSSDLMPRLQKAYGDLPMYFIQNDGQLDRRVVFYEEGAGHATFFTKQGVYLRLKGNQFSEAVRLMPISKTKDPRIIAEELQEGRVNYFVGNDPGTWKANIATYRAVVYEEIYPGIDMKFHGNNRQLEYDLLVKPGADPSSIRLSYQGIDSFRLTENGDLKIGLRDGEIIQNRPYIYQEIDGNRIEIAGKFRLLTGRPTSPGAGLEIGFEVADYDKKQPLIIDPVLLYSTYLGGFSGDGGFDIAVDPIGNAYVTGSTTSTDFPTMNPVQTALNGPDDVFVTKLNASGSALVYSTYLGGSGSDIGLDIAVDSSGNVYVTGSTNSINFPIANPFQAANGGATDAFVTRLNATGSALDYSTYLGGSSDDFGRGIAVDTSGSVHVVGETYSTNFPTDNAIQGVFGGSFDAFVTKLDATGSTLAFSTYLGGSSGDAGRGIAVDGSGNAYVIGETASTNFPTVNPLQTTSAGGVDAFVTKIVPSGSAFVFSTYLGGISSDRAYGIAVDALSGAYVVGSTLSLDFPTVNPFQAANAGGIDAFVTKINSEGSALAYSTYLGGSGGDAGGQGPDIAIDTAGQAYITGVTDSTNFPTANPIQGTLHGSNDAFVAKVNAAGSSLVYSTYLGGNGNTDEGRGIAVNVSGNAYITGVTQSIDFPTANPFQAANDGVADVFVTKITELADLLMITVTPGQSSVRAGRKLPVTDTVRNQGAITTSTFSVAYRLSVNAIYGDGDDITITKTRSISSLAAGASNTATTSVTVPSSTPPGNYYVCAKADSTSVVVEGDETNNTLCSATTVAVLP